MITSVHIAGFKSLVDVTLDLGSVNVFIGANGAGKSNVLEAIGVASAAISGQVDDESLKRRGVRLGVPALYKSSFRDSKLKSHIRLEIKGEFDGEVAEYRTNLNNPINKPTRRWSYKNELLKDDGGSSGMSPASNLGYDSTRSWVALNLVQTPTHAPRAQLAHDLADYAIFSANTPTLRGQEPDALERDPIGLAGGGLPKAILEMHGQRKSRQMFEFLRQNVDWVKSYGYAFSTDLPIAEGVPQRRAAIRFHDKYMSESRNVLSGYDASEGVLYLMFCATLALHLNSPKIFAIDNFDQALNPRLARSLASVFTEWIIQEERQCLLTTHNPLVLDGLQLLDDRVRLFAVDRDGAGRTTVERICVTPEMIARSRNGFPLSQQWISGLFGGVPDV